MRERTTNRLLLGTILALVGGVVTTMATSLWAPPIDDATGCLEAGVSAETTVLIDASDPIPDALLDSVLQIVLNVAFARGPDHRVRLFVLGGGNEVDLVALDAFCNPLKDGEGGSAYRERISRTLEDRVRGVLDVAAAGQRLASPILEATDRLRARPELAVVPKRDLILISDLLQNTDLLSFYPGKPGYSPPSSFKQRGKAAGSSPFWQHVAVFELQRPGLRALQTRALRRFWTGYFGRISGKVALHRL